MATLDKLLPFYNFSTDFSKWKGQPVKTNSFSAPKPLSLKRHSLDKSSEPSDFFFNVPAFINYYRNPEAGGINLNTASLSVPPKVVREKAKKLAKKDSRFDTVSKVFSDWVDGRREKRYRKTREAAAGLIHSQSAFPPAQIVLARNTTEASSMAFWLTDFKVGDKVLFSTAEHVSVRLAFLNHDDHGCPGDSNHASWARHYKERGQKYEPMKPTPTDVKARDFNPWAPDIKSELKNSLIQEAKMLMISHVDRTTGKILPVKEIIQAARRLKPGIFILVDGAQALGSLPKVDFDDLGCDAYIASPHKLLGSEVCGLMYVNPKKYPLKDFSETFNRLSAKSQQVILKGMFDPSTGIRANVKDSLALGDAGVLPKAINYLTKNHGLDGANFTKIAQHREQCRKSLSEKLQQKLGNKIRIEIPSYDNCTSLIMNLKIPEINQKELAETLSSQKIFLTYLGRQDCYRISFQPTTTEEELDNFVRKLAEEIPKLSGNKLNIAA